MPGQVLSLCDSAGHSKDGRAAPLPPRQPMTAAGTTWPNPPRTEKQKEVILRQKMTDVHIGFGLEAKNVDLMIRDES